MADLGLAQTDQQQADRDERSAGERHQHCGGGAA
jgi:hypothetical protein